jgi:hypothetical protein
MAGGKEGKVKVVYVEKSGSGVGLALVSVAFSLVGIFTPLAILCLPFAFLLMVVSLIRAALSLSFLGLSTAVLAGVFVVLGYASSPVALAALIAVISRVMSGAAS